MLRQSYRLTEWRPLQLTGSAVLLASLSACAPTVTVAPPAEPITINLNVKIEHEIQVKVEKDLESVLSADSGLF